MSPFHFLSLINHPEIPSATLNLVDHSIANSVAVAVVVTCNINFSYSLVTAQTNELIQTDKLL